MMASKAQEDIFDTCTPGGGESLQGARLQDFFEQSYQKCVLKDEAAQLAKAAIANAEYRPEADDGQSDDPDEDEATDTSYWHVPEFQYSSDYQADAASEQQK